MLFWLLAAGCINRSADPESRKAGPSDMDIRYAKRFRIESREGYSVLTIIDPWQGAQNIRHTFYLVKAGSGLPAGIDPMQVINVPVKKLISMSTTYLSMISALEKENSIVGISGTDLIFNDLIRERAQEGIIRDVGFEDNLNKELVINLAPDLVMVYGVGGESSGYLNKLRDLGIKIIFNADYMEDEPLAKAEWIKVFGALYDRQEEADSIFMKISEEYTRIRDLINEKATRRPKVLLGLPWKDTWYISPGNSFMSRLIADAGGDYLWKDTQSSTSMPYGVESVWIRAMEADYWLNISTVSKPEEIVNTDYRLGELQAFIKGNLYNNNKRITPKGGNDYWESGSVSPHIILLDIASILHPELFPDHELFYYKKVK